MSWKLKSLEQGTSQGPVVVVVMDGLGVGAENDGNAIWLARTPTLDRLRANYPYMILAAHGLAVGLPSNDDMGNSEVGHNALGAGRIFAQGAKLVNDALYTRSLFEGAVWKELTTPCTTGDHALHFLGLLSDGNVHSHIDHLLAMITEAHLQGVQRLFVHVLLDGRDVPETSALLYVEQLERHLAKLNEANPGVNYAIASGGGRMKITMDRYEADWNMVERGYNVHVHGQGRGFPNAAQAIATYRDEQPGIIDQDLPAFVITNSDGPIGPIRDGDSVILFNFRGDRAIEISRAFEEESFTKFDRGVVPRVRYAGIMEYDGDYHIPKRYLVNPPAIARTMSEYLVHNGVTQFACSETQKFGHVTYFWNGNRGGYFDERLETYQEIHSDRVSFDERPWMKAAQITDATIAALESGKFRFLRINYPNCDMVGHTGNLEAAVVATQAVDLCLRRLLAAVQKAKGTALLVADHGNADEMFQLNKKTGAFQITAQGVREAKTSHTLNPVPCHLYHPSAPQRFQFRNEISKPGLANVTATILNLLGYQAPEGYEASLVSIDS
jgi:2,3-bisphosphoglycerate-independent phosphoglycerate mutase